MKMAMNHTLHVHDTGFASLPEDLLVTVLIFLDSSPTAIAAMDLACAPSVRASFLVAIRNPCIIMQQPCSIGDACLQGYVEWLNARQVRIQRLELQTNNAQHYALLDQQLLHGIQEMEVLESFVAADAFDSLLEACNQLQKVAVHASVRNTFPAILQCITAHALPLHGFKYLSRETLLSAEHAIQLVTAFQQSLQELDLTCSTATKPVLDAIQQCFHLKKLAVGISANASEFSSFLDHTLLEEFTFYFFLHHQCLLFTEPALTVIAPHMSRLRGLKVYPNGCKVPVRCFSILIAACPLLVRLELPNLVYQNTSAGGIPGCALTITKHYDPLALIGILQDKLTVCPVPLLALHGIAISDGPALWKTISLAGTTLQTVTDTHGHPNHIVVTKYWLHADVVQVLSRCSALVSLHLVDGHNPAAYNIKDSHLQVIAEHCHQLQGLAIEGASAITDGGFQALLAACGAKLTTLMLERCNKITIRSLRSMVEHCPNLQELTLLKTGVRTKDLLLFCQQPLPRRLNKLTVGSGTYGMLVSSEAIPACWKDKLWC